MPPTPNHSGDRERDSKCERLDMALLVGRVGGKTMIRLVCKKHVPRCPRRVANMVLMVPALNTDWSI